MASLTPADVSAFKARLLARERELRQTIHSALINSEDQKHNELADRVLDSAEQSVANMLADDKILTIEKEVSELDDVVASLARITAGTYGTCIDCDDEIGVPRLEAYPTAKRCIRCQTHYEKHHRGVGRDTTPSL